MMSTIIIKKYQSIILGIFLLTFFIFLPVFEIRLLITCIVALKLLNSKLNLRISTFPFLLLLFMFAYIFSPYWNAFGAPQEKNIAFVLLLTTGLCWSFFSSSSVSWNFRTLWKPPLILLTFLIYLINYVPLHADIAYRGDEDHHINVLLDMFNFLQHSVLIPITQVTRYPMLERWINLIFVFPNPFGDIALYRFVTFLAMILLAWLIYFECHKLALSEWTSIAIAFIIATLPTVYFFSSLLYMEMPIVLLMTFVIFNGKKLIDLPPKSLKSTSVWYALLMISFLKETALSFLVMCMVFRALCQLYHSKQNWHTFIKSVFNEGFLFVLVVTPNIIFQYIRWRFPVIYNNPPVLWTIKNLSTYPILFKEYCQEFGLFLIPVVLGIIVYFFKREYKIMLFLLTVFCAQVLLFLIMRADYVGYARFNLFILPVFVVAAINFFAFAKEKITIVMIAAIFISNIVLSPIHLDGARLPNWGSPTVDTAEYSYPYEKTVKLLTNTLPNSPLILLGQYYPYYGLRYYFGKYNYHPQVYDYGFNYSKFDEVSERVMLDRFFSEYKSGGLSAGYLSANVILFHSVNNINLNESILYGDAFKIIKRIKNSEHSLYLFQKK